MGIRLPVSRTAIPGAKSFGPDEGILAAPEEVAHRIGELEHRRLARWSRRITPEERVLR